MGDPIKLALKLFNNINTKSVNGKVPRIRKENWEPLYQINSKCLGQRELEKKCLKYFIGYFIGKITDFINDINNKEYLQNTFSYLKFDNFDLIINDMNNMLFNGRII